MKKAVYFILQYTARWNILLFSCISISRIFSSISANYLYEDFASWDPWLRPKYFSRTYLPGLSAITISHDTSHTRVYVYKSFIKYILWLGKTNCSVSYNLITVSCHVSVISTIHHVQKIFFSWRASPRKILYLLTDDGILYYLMWTLGVPFFSNWPFVNSNQTKCLSLTKLHFQIYLLWRYGMMMIMRWKKFLGIKKKN